MIKFFRTIRKKLVEQNKTGNYLKYAIGEIVLVVIGILIALQINNWNEYRKERKVEINILNEIYDNLNVDRTNLQLKIDETQSFKLANLKVLEHLENKTPLNDSLNYYYARLNAYGTFRAVTAGYENLKSKGVDLIQNDSLRSSILQLYDYEYFHFVEDIVHSISTFRSTKSAYFNERIYLDDGIYTSGLPYNLTELQNDDKFKGYLKSTMVIHDWMNSRRTSGLLKIEGMMQAIEKELNN
jgi:hypothetical protein